MAEYRTLLRIVNPPNTLSTTQAELGGFDKHLRLGTELAAGAGVSYSEVAETTARVREAGESLREWRDEIVQSELLPILEQLERISFGERGEKAVGAALAGLGDEGYRVFHSVRYQRCDIDHVLVGPAGVFAIETKHPRSSGLITFRNGQGIFVDGKPKWRGAIKQVQNAGRKVYLAVKKHCATEGVMPVVVFVGHWRVADQWQPTDVRVLTAATLPDYIREQQPVLTRAEIEHIAAELEASSAAS